MPSVTETRGKKRVQDDSANNVISRRDEPVRHDIFLKTVYIQEICTELTLGKCPSPVLYFEVFLQRCQTQEEICKNSQNGVLSFG